MDSPTNAPCRDLILWKGEEYEVPAPLVAYLDHQASQIELVADQVKETQRALVTVAETLRMRPGSTAPQPPLTRDPEWPAQEC